MKKTGIILLTGITVISLMGCGSNQQEMAAVEQEAVEQEAVEEEAVEQEAVEEEVANMSNPWVYCDRSEVNAATGIDLNYPDGATDVQYGYLTTDGLAQVTYTFEGSEWIYRAQPSAELMDVSGMYYEWTSEMEGTVSGRVAKYLGYSEEAENTDTTDGIFDVQVVNWYDAVPGITYSLSVSGTDLDGIDIQSYAESVFECVQGDATDDPEQDAINEINDYFLGEHIRSEDESSIVITDLNDGTFKVDISIIGLCSLEDGVGTFDDHKMYFTVADPNGNDLSGMIFLDSDNTLDIRITDSTWDYLPVDETLTGFGK